MVSSVFVLIQCFGLLCYGAVLWRALHQLDSLDTTARRHAADIHSLKRSCDEAERAEVFIDRDIRKLRRQLEAIQQKARAVETTVELIPGDVHPFAVDAFVTVSDARPSV